MKQLLVTLVLLVGCGDGPTLPDGAPTPDADVSPDSHLPPCTGGCTGMACGAGAPDDACWISVELPVCWCI